MGFREKFSFDLRLRNLTIYAQWASVSAALMLCITNILLLIPRFHKLSGLTGAAYYVPAIQGLIQALFFPLTPLALDLPRYVPRYTLYVTPIAWLNLPIGHLTMVPERLNLVVEIIKVVVLLFTILLFVQITAYNFNMGVLNSYLHPHLPERADYNLNNRILNPHARPSLRTRAAVNFIYFEQLLLTYSYIFSWSSEGDWRPSYGMTAQWYRFLTVVFGAAMVLYIIAWKKGHQWVSSVTLGGTAIEPMVLSVSLTGPVYQTVGDEATEGAIRLV